MGNKKIEAMFNAMKEEIDTIKALYREGLMYESRISAYEKIDECTTRYMNTLGGLFHFGVISEKTFDYGFSLLSTINKSAF